jgi:hypothetical protein
MTDHTDRQAEDFAAIEAARAEANARYQEEMARAMLQSSILGAGLLMWRELLIFCLGIAVILALAVHFGVITP